MFNQSYGVHIMLLVINSLGADTHTQTHTYTDVRTGKISRNQAHGQRALGLKLLNLRSKYMYAHTGPQTHYLVIQYQFLMIVTF